MVMFGLNKLYRKTFPCLLSWFVVLRLTSAGENLTDARTVICLENDSNVVLECGIYINNKSRLDSIKWFKNGREFFSYYPSIKSNDQPEINYYWDVGVDKNRSQKDRLYMKPINELHHGTYTCAVQEHSVDGNFIDHYREIVLQVVTYLPKNKPTLVIHKNDKTRYQVGDELSFKCSITVPKTAYITMDWYVRGKSVNKDICSLNETYTTNSHMYVFSIFVYKIEEQPTIREMIPVKCLVRIPSLYWQTSEIIIYVGDKSAGNKMCITNYFVVLTLASLIFSYLSPAVFK